ncbi:MAG: AraC family transcriptional regulator [Caldisericia bacterium]|nr:AraC family transcriptional regulator [Caldisericia bacterium]
MSANCKSCGRIMTKPEDYSGGNLENQYCSSCTNADGSMKSLDEITLHIANQLIMSQGIDREAATKAARSILSVQPQWRKQTQKKR